MMGVMRTSQEGLNLIASFEGFRGAPYNDPVGHATIGYGHLIHRGNVTQADRQRWGTLTKAQALELLRKDVVTYESAVNKYVQVKLSQPQFDALTSFTYNNGAGSLQKSTLLRKLNDGDYRGAADELPKWVYADGHPLEGLRRRRNAERALFLAGTGKPVPRLDVSKLQRVLNDFTNSGKWVKGVKPLIVDGDWGPATAKRVQEIKYWLGYGVSDTTHPPLFHDRVKHPLEERIFPKKMIQTGKRRRRAQRLQYARTHAQAVVDPNLGKFEGVVVAKWLVPYLEDARKEGWKGHVYSGYRTPAYSEKLCIGICGRPVCPGRCAGRASGHSQKVFPGGCVDVSDYVNFARIQLRIRKAPNRLVNAIGPSDPNHFSISGR